MIRWGFFLWSSLLFAFYSNPELERLWGAISNINNPTLSDYFLINEFFKNSEKPYLDPLRVSMGLDSLENIEGYRRRFRQFFEFNFIGPQNQMPLFEIHKINERKETEKRCVLIYASYNRLYPSRAHRLLLDLEKAGYSGHVLLRIGGFPNTPYGGLKICHIPYAFKVAFFREAQNLGYQHVLWLDTSLHPLDNLERIFSEIEEKGYFVMSSCSLRKSLVGYMDSAMKALSLNETICEKIPHISSPIFGLNYEYGEVNSFLNEWMAETENVYPYMSLFHEELSLSVVAWHHSMKPQYSPWDIYCLDQEVIEPYKLGGRPFLHFYIDSTR